MKVDVWEVQVLPVGKWPREEKVAADCVLLNQLPRWADEDESCEETGKWCHTSTLELSHPRAKGEGRLFIPQLPNFLSNGCS